MPARSLWRLQLVLAVAAAVKPPGIRSPRLTRRSLLAAAPAACALAVMPPVPAARAASLTAELREAEAALAASDGSTVLASINRLLELSSEYGGMPSDALRKELIEKVRAKRSELKGVGGWDEGSYGEKEEQYLRLQRVVDPWRVVELEGRAQLAVLGFAPVYIGLLGVQQVVPKLFNPAYAAGVALLFGPLLFQILFG